MLWQPRFAELLGGASRATRTFGYVVVAMSLGAAAGAWLADRLPGAVARRPQRMAAAATVLSAGVLAGLAAASWLVGGAVLVAASVLLAQVGDE